VIEIPAQDAIDDEVIEVKRTSGTQQISRMGQKFLGRSNPWALRDMAERLLEAHHRGLWEGADPQRLARLKELVLESESLVEQR